VIEQAVGIILARFDCAPERAREMLTETAASGGIPLRVFACDVVEPLTRDAALERIEATFHADGEETG
jgi:hypothetical protein